MEWKKQPGEWANAGDTVIRVVQMDKLRVKANVDIHKYSPDELLGSKVSVSVRLSHGNETFPGTITFVSQIAPLGGEYEIWADVDNRMRNEHWILRGGMVADMSVAGGTSTLAQTAVSNLFVGGSE
jgi:hypothetical protein